MRDLEALLARHRKPKFVDVEVTQQLQLCQAPECERTFEPRANKDYCSARCRVRAWRRRHSRSTSN